MSSFEEARHQGYSMADMAADIAEAEARAQDLGCNKCQYGCRNSPTCDFIRKDVDNVFVVCPYFKEV